MKTVTALLLLLLTPASGLTQDAPALGAPTATPAYGEASLEEEEFSKLVEFGKRYFDLRDYTSSHEQFAKADRIRPNQAAVLYNMAVVLAKLGRYGESQELIDRYSKLFPTGAEAPMIARLGRDLEFQRDLQRRRQADQEYQELFNRAKFSYERGDLEAAARGFQDAEQKRPNDASVAYNQAVVSEKRGDFAKALERFRRYAELDPDAGNKALIDQKIFALETEITDMRTKVLCSFCGQKLTLGSTWCHRCWHGPYSVDARWSSRTCSEGASATRTTFFSDGRVDKNEDLSCLLRDGTSLETFRYTPTKQREIQSARRTEGWIYSGDVIQSWSDQEGNKVTLEQGEVLDRIVFEKSGSMLDYRSHKSAGDHWLLDSEQLVVDGQLYNSNYTFDEKDHIIAQQVSYQNTAACNHLITAAAAMTYDGDNLIAARFRGGYDGYPQEGSPQVQWEGVASFTYDAAGRLSKEEFALTKATKTYMARPQAATHDEIYQIYPSMRTKKTMDILKSGDLCASAGGPLLGNTVDLRPFYTLSPNLSVELPLGITRVTVTMTYPESFRATDK